MRQSFGRSHAIDDIREEDIAAIMQDQPTLSSYGLGCFSQYHPDLRGDLTVDLRESRDQLLGSVEHCSNVCDWLYPVAKSKTINKQHSSYSLKHYVERLYKPFYCYNGSFIVAAIHLGFRCVRSGSAEYFNFDQTSLSRQLVTK